MCLDCSWTCWCTGAGARRGSAECVLLQVVSVLQHMYSNLHNSRRRHIFVSKLYVQLACNEHVSAVRIQVFNAVRRHQRAAAHEQRRAQQWARAAERVALAAPRQQLRLPRQLAHVVRCQVRLPSVALGNVLTAQAQLKPCLKHSRVSLQCAVYSAQQVTHSAREKHGDRRYLGQVLPLSRQSFSPFCRAQLPYCSEELSTVHVRV